jgi:hypothetical protein
MYGYVYYIKNIINGRPYVGSHTAQHFDDSYYGSGKLIKRALNIYGKESFKRKIIYRASSYEDMIEKENHFIKKLIKKHGKNAYNLAIDAKNPCTGLYGKNNPHFGLKRKKDTCDKISEAQKKYQNKLKREGILHFNQGIVRDNDFKDKVKKAKRFANTISSKNDVFTSMMIESDISYVELPKWVINIISSYRGGIWQKEETIKNNIKKVCMFFNNENMSNNLISSYLPDNTYYKGSQHG